MHWQLHCGDVANMLAELPDESVNCVVTSPPYWGLRDYGHAGQIGLEATPQQYVTAVASLFSEALLKRVLRGDGVVWLNLGDSYSGVGAQTGGTNSKEHGKRAERMFSQKISWRGVMPKNLIGIPWQVAFAIQSRGWYLRSEVIWAKPNPMPESVKDRPTKAHETVFLLTKSERYAYHADAIREPVTQAMLDQLKQGYDGEGQKDYEANGVQNPSDVKARIIARARDKQRGHGRRHAGFNDRWDGLSREEQMAQGANARTVWTIPTEPSPYDHFAVMPRALARRCILAGCAPGGTVLDPFAGVCITGVVALEEGRNFVGIELNPKYHAIGRERLAGVAPLLATEISA